MSGRKEITATGLSIGQGSYSHDLHLSRGLRGQLAESPLLFDIMPVHGKGPTIGVGPFNLYDAHQFATALGLRVLGIDTVEQEKTPLVNRTWRPIVPSKRMHAADLWSVIHGNLDDDRARERDLARYINFSIHAAGIRIRDASDHYHNQLLDAVADRKEVGSRFKNVQLFDIRLALHSILSELASARDYLATWFAVQLGAPDRIDSLNRLADWLSGRHRGASPVGLSDLLAAYDGALPGDSWAKQLTDLRNLHLHREPLGSGQFLHFELCKFGAFTFPTIRYPMPTASEEPAGCDYLEVLSDIFGKFEALAAKVAINSGVSTEMALIRVE